MKKITYSLAALVMTVALASCDNIAEGDRLTYVAPVEVSKNVLIEDFTGQHCRNCPEATEAIHELQETYGKTKVIAVGLYSGPFGKKNDGTLLPLTTETGNYYYDRWKVEQQPCLNIDRNGLTSDNQILKTRVRTALQGTTTVTINPSVSYDATTKQANIAVNVGSSETIAGAKLQVWLMEDSITSPQVMPTGKTNKTYMHNHVFRTTMTDRDGKSISLDANKPVAESFSAGVDDSWNPKNLSVVVFVFNDEGVKQTEIVPLQATAVSTESNQE